MPADGLGVDPEHALVEPGLLAVEREPARANQHGAGFSPRCRDELVPGGHAPQALLGAHVARGLLAHVAPVERIVAPGHETGPGYIGLRPLDMRGKQHDVDHGEKLPAPPLSRISNGRASHSSAQLTLTWSPLNG